MKIFEDRLSLGHNKEVAYFIKCEAGYLCIFENEDENSIFEKIYEPGKIYNLNVEDKNINEIIEVLNSKILDESPLKGTFLFEQFLKGLK